MSHSFGEISFTPGVKKQQELHGSRRQYARMEGEGADTGLGPYERAFIQSRDGFYMASVTETGWPYVQYRGGPKGFLQVVDAQTIAFADLRGNKQYISLGNLLHDNRVALFLMDYAFQRRLKILGRARVLEGDDEARSWMAKLRTTEKGAVPERAMVIKVEAFDWNCPQHITPRFTAEEWMERTARSAAAGSPNAP